VRSLVVVLVLLAGCGDDDVADPDMVQTLVVKPPHDSTRFSVPAKARRCGDGRSLLLEAASQAGSGVLVMFKVPDSVTAGSYPVLWAGDTAARKGAMVSVRYVIRDSPSSFALDSGTVDLERAGERLRGRIVGRGIENAIRMFASVEFHDVPLRPSTDTVNCLYQS
jgi:hypothetical protein